MAGKKKQAMVITMSGERPIHEVWTRIARGLPDEFGEHALKKWLRPAFEHVGGGL